MSELYETRDKKKKNGAQQGEEPDERALALVCASELRDRLEELSPPRGIYHAPRSSSRPPPTGLTLTSWALQAAG